MEYRSILIFMHPFAQVAPVPALVGVAGFVRWPGQVAGSAGGGFTRQMSQGR